MPWIECDSTVPRMRTCNLLLLYCWLRLHREVGVSDCKCVEVYLWRGTGMVRTKWKDYRNGSKTFIISFSWVCNCVRSNLVAPKYVWVWTTLPHLSTQMSWYHDDAISRFSVVDDVTATKCLGGVVPPSCLLRIPIRPSRLLLYQIRPRSPTTLWSHFASLLFAKIVSVLRCHSNKWYVGSRSCWPFRDQTFKRSV